MTRAYIRIEPDLVRRLHAKGYPSGAIAAFISVLCEAETQVPRGRFRNERVLKALMDTADVRFVAYLLQHGDLVRQQDGTLYVDGWDEWQEGNWQVAERMKRVRERRDRRNVGDGADRNNGDGADRNNGDAPQSNGAVFAVSGKPLAHSNKNPLPPTDLPAEPEREGLKNPETMARAEKVVDWWMRQQGWPSLSGVTRHRLVTQATSYAEMPISDDELMAMLQVGWDSMPSDNKPHDLNFFATRAEQLVGTILKSRRPVIVEGRLPAGVGAASDRDPDE